MNVRVPTSKQLVELLDQLPAVVWLFDTSGEVLYVNQVASVLTGYTHKELVSMSVLELVVPEEREEAVQSIRHALRTRREVKVRYRLRCKDGSVLPVQVQSSPVVQGGEVVALRGVAVDVTELARAEEEARETSSQMAEADRRLREVQHLEALARLAGGVAHDFNNLLGVIRGHADVLLEELDGHPATEDLRQVVRASQQAAELTSQLLTFGRRQPTRPLAMDLDLAVQEALRMLSRLLPADIELSPRLEGAGWVWADPVQVDQAILNLALNARDAMPRGGRLELRTRLVSLEAPQGDLAPGDYGLLEVQDTGEGMDAATQARIFEPFFTTKAPGRGTGLGMSTTYGYARQSGGDVQVHSELGQGTRIGIYLPTTSQPPAPVAPPDEEAPGGQGQTILIAEDESMLRRLAARILAQAGYAVLVASDGQEAIRVSREHEGEIQLLLTDMVMPGYRGEELAEVLVRERPGLRVLFMSGYAEDVLHGSTLRRDIQWLQKPFSSATLLKRVWAMFSAGVRRP